MVFFAIISVNVFNTFAYVIQYFSLVFVILVLCILYWCWWWIDCHLFWIVAYSTWCWCCYISSTVTVRLSCPSLSQFGSSVRNSCTNLILCCHCSIKIILLIECATNVVVITKIVRIFTGLNIRWIGMVYTYSDDVSPIDHVHGVHTLHRCLIRNTSGWCLRQQWFAECEFLNTIFLMLEVSVGCSELEYPPPVFPCVCKFICGVPLVEHSTP